MGKSKKYSILFLCIINFLFLTSVAQVSLILAIFVCAVISGLFLGYRIIIRYAAKEKQNINLNAIDTELYAIMCNAYLEHEEEMKDYKKYYNINDESAD